MKVYFDGSTAPTNPGPCAVGIVIPGKNIRIREEIGYGTNNFAEWIAMLTAVQIALNEGYRDVEIIGDSMLVISQAQGKWKIKHREFIPYRLEFDNLKVHFNSITLTHVKRNRNLAGIFLEEFMAR